MPSVYSERFVYSERAGVWAEWIVPDKKRAIVRSVAVANRDALAGLVVLQVGPTYPYMRNLPAQSSVEVIDMRQVAYQGDLIAAYSAQGGVFITVAGYLFDDIYGQGGGPGRITHRLPDRTKPVPE